MKRSIFISVPATLVFMSMAMLKSWSDFELTGSGEFIKKALQGEVVKYTLPL